MKDPIPTIQTEKAIAKDKSSILLGSIVALKTHPYVSDNTEVKIATYNHLTPPLMVVVAVKRNVTFNSDTGEKDKTSYQCLYYASIGGTFAENWFRGDQIKNITIPNDDFYDKHKDMSLSTMKKELIGKLAALKTVDLELRKKQVFQVSSVGAPKLREKNLLDFLPPVGTIISVSISENHKKYDEKTGKNTLSKSRILVKLRWFNNKSSKFSEEDVPLCSLIEIEPHEVKEFDKEQVYIFSKAIPLEGRPTFKVKAVPVKFQDITFSHYYYDYRFKNLFTGEIVTISQDDLTAINQSSLESKKLLDMVSTELKDSPIGFFTVENEAVWKNEWFEIRYLARNGRYTRRIIYINELMSLSIDKKSEEKAIKANCLLREGAIRNFRLKGILAYRKMPAEFMELFVVANE